MKKISLIILLFLSLSSFAQSHYPGQQKGKFIIEDKTPAKVMAFDLQNVRLLDSPFKDNMERSSKWILSLKVKSLLHSFRTNAGVFSGNEGGYMVTPKLGGWESLDCDIRGHTTGHVLSALAMFYGTTGNEIYRLKADSLVKGLAEVQATLNQGGYLSAFPQNLIDRNIASKTVWVPWYTLHKIFAGLIDQYLYCDNKQALDIVVKMADWAYNKLKPLNEEQRTKMLRNEFGGLNDSFYNLYAITGNPNDKWLAEFFYHNEALDPMKEHVDNLNKKHANTNIPKLIGLVRDNEIEGNHANLETADFFWNTVVDHHSFCTGSNSDKEHFFLPDHQSVHLTGLTGESCNVYNMLKLTRHLFCANPDEKYADYYEKALFNHILGQQDDKTGMISYFLPMLAGADKVYSTPESSFWCCVGTGFENQAKFGESIYYHDNKGIFVNMFIPSTLIWKEKQMELKQETSFPENGKTTITITKADKNTKFAVYLRYPSWAKNVKVTLNGKKINVKQAAGSYITISRNWKAGDVILADFGMELTLATTPDNPDKAAIMYGPIVLAGEMGTEGFTGSQPFSDPTKYNDYYTYDYHIPAGFKSTLNMDKKNLTKTITRKGQSLEFTTSEGYTLKPLYSLHRQRYVVYWDITTETAP